MIVDRLEYIRQQSMEDYGFGPDTMKKIKVCSRCGRSSDVSELFCKECGYRLPDKTLYDIYKERHRCCPVCDTILATEMDYCPQCGTKIEKTKQGDI